MANAETNLQAEIMLALSKAGCKVFRNNTGAFMDEKSGRLIRYGVGGKGGPDLWGICHDGLALAVEVKTATGRVRPEQLQFIDMAKKAGARAGIARSVEDALKIARGEEIGC